MSDSASEITAFSDHFSNVAAGYAAYRPRYPDALFDAIKSEVHRGSASAHRTLVWDCAAGTGQASLPLGQRFSSVLATDVSTRQLSQASQHANVQYATAAAESCPLRNASANLVTVAQALHWFRFDEFWREVKRVLVPNGLIVAWSYGLLRVDDNKEVEQLIDDFSERAVGSLVATRTCTRE